MYLYCVDVLYLWPEHTYAQIPTIYDAKFSHYNSNHSGSRLSIQAVAGFAVLPGTVFSWLPVLYHFVLPEALTI